MTSDVLMYLLVGFAAGVLAMYFADKRIMYKRFEEGLKVGIALSDLAEHMAKGGEEVDNAD